MTPRALGTGLLMAGICLAPAVNGQQLRISVPDEYKYECTLDRTMLATTQVAANPEIYPTLATRVDGGWLVYDEFFQQVVELDDELAEVRRWGRRGPGPLEYGHPVAIMRLSTGEVVIVDDTPPSVMVMGGADPNEHVIQGLEPEAAMVAPDGTILTAGLYGDVHVVDTDGEMLREVASPQDFGLPGGRSQGAYPEMLIRPPFVGFLGPSTVWRLVNGGKPRQVIQRCLHEDLARIHERAPLIEIPSFGEVPYTVITMYDFLPLPDGILTFGGLNVNPQLDRSLEFYDESGALRGAWQLTGYPGARGVFDPQDPRRILIWNKENIEGTLLIEVDGARFPTGT